MTTQTQPDPKPEQLWRDLGPDEKPQVGDRIAVFNTHGPAVWELYNPAVNYQGVNIWQRPVTPGQCDCAGLREALEQIRTMSWHQVGKAAIHIAEEALAQPHTCAGRIQCLECGSTDHQHVPSCSKVLSQTSETRTEQTCAGKSAERDAPWQALAGDEAERELGGREVRDAWISWAQTQPNPKPSWLVSWDDLDESNKEADRVIYETITQNWRAEVKFLEGERDEARRKLADLEGWKREQMQVAADTRYHEIAKEIGVPLGRNIASSILPAIQELKRKLADAEAKLAKERASHLATLRNEIEQTEHTPVWRRYANLRAELWSKVYIENIKLMPESCADTAVATFDKKFKNS